MCLIKLGVPWMWMVIHGRLMSLSEILEEAKPILLIRMEYHEVNSVGFYGLLVRNRCVRGD